MEYRKLPHGNEKISVLGFGTSSIGEASEGEIIATVQKAIDHGINYFDLASGHANTFAAFGKVIQEKREQIYLQIHFGANYETGEYGWTTNLAKIKASVKWQLEMLQTDYIDFGFIHCLDELADLQAVKDAGIIDYLLELKQKGIVRHLGLSSHTPALVNQVLDMKIIDMVMFSINPAYDHHHGDYAIGETDERLDLYKRCEKEGVAISVMKAFSAGQLLDANKSPFKYALTHSQCIQYALDKPGVVTVLPGIRNHQDLDDVLKYLDASDSEKDYSIIASFNQVEHLGNCVYCKHCHPCPAKLDIALINKYYDLALLGDTLAKDHYLHLEKKASDCLKCGHCNHRCPFKVDQMARMDEIATYFGV
ncbi:aldo/keto reductase [uncultured Thomasclavelia sp.]|uniref:aldo/keto reductase n=1 Tax=uncultured Thomasclavelia sp. TaxID=3025759 RepID=UPI0025F3B481|nr:aldo/keto reductase [uncultured Thomasclavelia sp.]